MDFNKERHDNALRRLLVAVILLALAASCISCTSPGYEKFTLREGISHFSFEYPENYEERLVRTESEYTDVKFQHYLSGDFISGDDRTDSLLGVSISEEGRLDIWASAEIALEWTVSYLREAYEDFQVLKRSEININGVKGEMLVCSYTPTEAPEDYDPFWWGPSLLLRRHVYFDYDGFIWEIWMVSHENRAEADEPVWEHLIGTFRILD